MKHLVAAAALLSIAGMAMGQESPRYHEFLENLYYPPESPRVTNPALNLSSLLDGNTFVQVNTDPAGNNIVNDAANEPSIAIDPTAPNRMAIGWRQFDNIASNFRQAGCAYTNDGGRTWTTVGPLDKGVFRSDPVLSADADGNFYYYSLTNVGGYSCQMFISPDGENWTNPISAYGGDKAWVTIDCTGGVGDTNIYAAWDWAGCCGNDWFTRSTDLGLTYMPPVPITGQPIWGTNTVGPDGTYYMVGRAYSTNTRIVLAKSTNAQYNSQTPTFTSVDVPLGGVHAYNLGRGPNPGGLHGNVIVNFDESGGPMHGNLYVLACVDPPGDDPLDVMIARSEDGGQTWAPPVRVNNDPAGTNAYQWMAAMSVAPNGRIDVAWNDTRDAGQDNISELFYSFSTDGGRTWSTNEKLSAPWDSIIGWPNQKKIGDYYDMDSDLIGADLAWSATFTGGQDVYYLRINDYDCNGNGIGDELDFQSGFAQDCNANGIPDSCEIAAGAVPDLNGNGIPDPCDCYADCDHSTGIGVLDIFDFLCFQDSFINAEPYACECVYPGYVCDIFDFLCFQDAFVAGCP